MGLTQQEKSASWQDPPFGLTAGGEWNMFTLGDSDSTALKVYVGPLGVLPRVGPISGLVARIHEHNEDDFVSLVNEAIL
jgi:hypothetical protein